MEEEKNKLGDISERQGKSSQPPELSESLQSSSRLSKRKNWVSDHSQAIWAYS